MAVFKVPFLIVFVTLLNGSSSKIIRHTAIKSRIVGGMNATNGQFPYYAQLVSTVRVKLSLNSSYIAEAYCGGSVISSNHILTAGHCVKDVLSVKIILGLYNINDANGLQTRTAKTIHVHENFNSMTFINDIAVLELDTEIAFTDNIQPIQLSCAYTQQYAITQVAGRGLTRDTDTELPDNLQWTYLTTISNAYCAKFYATIFSFHLCAYGNEKQSACVGDSGSALIRIKNKTQMQVAVVSSSDVEGCERGYPNIFTRVSSYAKWIHQRSSVTCF